MPRSKRLDLSAFGVSPFREGTKADIFYTIAKPNKQGFSRRVKVSEFVGKYSTLQMGNGGSWCRDDGPLASHYNIERGKVGNRIDYVRLHGFKKSPIKKPIPKTIREKLADKDCVILGIGQVEIDHKDGRRDDPRLSDADRVELSDFQPLSKAANNAKRQHCKKCRETGKRFNAKTLGYIVSQVEGNGNYRGSCVGCYWYDPFTFNQKASGGADCI